MDREHEAERNERFHIGEHPLYLTDDAFLEVSQNGCRWRWAERTHERSESKARAFAYRIRIGEDEAVVRMTMEGRWEAWNESAHACFFDIRSDGLRDARLHR